MLMRDSNLAPRVLEIPSHVYTIAKNPRRQLKLEHGVIAEDIPDADQPLLTGQADSDHVDTARIALGQPLPGDSHTRGAAHMHWNRNP